MARTTIRCAIYTRKSSEEGLEQNFNSLDAQWEACKAYIESQKHEGWKLIETRYEDGGISGGHLERPGVRSLLDDIDAGRIDMVVVYKIDRLTRSLADFARLVERFDKANCSFVSVTQAFNTSTSMGRLTLNVLLSFAQFEREVTAERIRDKLAASARRGLWMGGLAPLGYDPHPDPNTRELVLNQNEAEQVQRLFHLYDQHRCLGQVARQAELEGIRSKRRTFRSGKSLGGCVMSRGAVHSILTNPVYRGMVRHKDNTYPGSHSAIIGEALWDRVQETLIKRSGRRRGQGGPDEQAGSPLTRRVFDEAGDRLTPTYATTRGKRWRYYVSRSLVSGSETSSAGWRLPAAKLEAAVAQAIRNWLGIASERLLAEPSVETFARVQAGFARIGEELASSRSSIIAQLVERIDLKPGEMRLAMNPESIAEATGRPLEEFAAGALVHVEAFTERKRGVETVLVLRAETPNRDETLINAVARAHAWMAEWRAGVSLPTLAKKLGWTTSPLRQRLKLAFLSPSIVQAILDGRQPADLSLEKLLRTDLPLDWDRQAEVLGFAFP
ncbi:recombinase family protein [Henriciella mobilis]|uniref:Recombinase family protein n=1 Tax=Henriciella mobilis TaxID=2305467 RepID=A0A399R5C6_9PROT|nr:recombinase family protein [Henriciella mobilis]RIJ14003.1 recombinase family protein [Henriciella mobilis]RIJ22469.1 recombinase family protein [Henriciella mobilis]RIJ26816.1 recombinase family protein [Henriciella mobilis]